MLKIYKKLDEIPQKINLAVYGAGGRGKEIISCIVTQRPDINICAVFDDFVEDNDIFGHKVLKYTESYKTWDHILIASIHVDEIVRNLKSDESVLLIDESASTPISQKISFRFFCKNFSNIIYSLRKFKNPFDYLTLLLKRLGFPVNISKYVVNRNFKKQYLDVLFQNQIKYAYDLGVHDGYTSIQFLNNFTNLRFIYGFDISFDALKSSINNNNLNKSNKFHFEKKAIYSHTGTIKINLNHENLSASKVVDDQSSSLEVECITLDEFKKYQTNKIDFIKFDIEGAEMQALKGGIKTIINDRPQLAVSIYHSPEDFIEIPVFLMRNLENYKFYIGHYSTGVFETVLYCTPRELYDVN
jgi:FkbM family methyltransferase